MQWHAGDVVWEPRSASRRTRRGHDEAVVRAEARRLVRALQPFGTLHRDALERECHADRWQEGGFVRAVAAAIDTGLVRAQPLGFYSVVREDEQQLNPAPSPGDPAPDQSER
jgi:hypothetical protein